MIDLAPPAYTPPETSDFVYNASRKYVACLWTGRKYGFEYVLRLKQAVTRNLSTEHSFVCFVDRANFEDFSQDMVDYGITPMVKTVEQPGWWGKLEMFDYRNWSARDRILYLDLDVVITGPLDDFFLADHHTTMIANFGVNFRHAKYNSSVVCWDGNGPAAKIYDEFMQQPGRVMKDLHGDQCFMWRVMVDDVKTWPTDWVVSYKYDVRRKALDPNTKIVVFHGDPKPDVVKDGFVIENWLHQG